METETIGMWVGLDWADEQHVFAWQRLPEQDPEVGSIRQKPEELDAWINGLRERAGGGMVAVAVEQSRGALVYALMEYEFVQIYPVNPKSLANYRKAFYPSGGKDDPSDARLILEYLLKHRDRLRRWQPDSAEVRMLRLASEERRKLVNLRTALTNQLTVNLKNYFPQALDWAGALKETLACDFLERWTDLSSLQKAKPASIRKLFRDHSCRNSAELEKKIQGLRQARALTTDPAIVTVGRMTTQSLTCQIRHLGESIQAFDLQIEKVFSAHDDSIIFKSFPGSGSALGPRLLALFGEDRDRFECAEQLQTLSGIAPIVKQSGKTRLVQCRWACPKFIRQSIHEYAAMSRHWCRWAAAYYAMQMAHGKKHHTAVRALAFKWLRIMYRCWKRRQPYNDELYMSSLRANNAPLLAYLQPEADCGQLTPGLWINPNRETK